MTRTQVASRDSVESAVRVEVRVDGEARFPTLVYLPGLHGDWTLLAGFRELAKQKFRLVQFTYPRTAEWTLDEYARAIDGALEREAIHNGWIVAESFGSQVAWAWLKRAHAGAASFQVQGLILAGGFVRYPVPMNLAAARLFFAIAPLWLWRLIFRVYLSYSGFRHRNAPGAEGGAGEFVERRTRSDLGAMRARLKLIAESDCCEVARATDCPIYQLAGVIDPVVPPAMVARWLRRNCRSFRGTRVIWPADHNVLGTEPAQAVGQIEHWMSACACLHGIDGRT